MLIQASILNCSLQTQDKLIMGSKGLIVGGRVQAQNGIDVYQVGSAQGAKAELVCGMDFEVLDKVVWARDQCLSLIKQMKTLEGLKKTEPSHVASLDSAIVRLRDQVRKLSEFSRAMSAKVDRNDEAAVVVRGLAHSGTYIEICHISYIVSRPMGRVRFVLDKRRGAVKPVPL
jgi:uncharacterized protein (DUF342 family)